MIWIEPSPLPTHRRGRDEPRLSSPERPKPSSATIDPAAEAMRPLLIALAGPNGAGKSTFYEAFLAHLELPFLNADRLAHETELDAYAAAREIAAIRDSFINRQQGFILETVLSDPVGDKVQMLDSAARSGFDVLLLFIGIEDAALSARRVAGRVKAGGHDVPHDKILARYPRSLANLESAIPLLPTVIVYDNSSFRAPFRLVAEFRNGIVCRRVRGPVPEWARKLLPGQDTEK